MGSTGCSVASYIVTVLKFTVRNLSFIISSLEKQELKLQDSNQWSEEREQSLISGLEWRHDTLNQLEGPRLVQTFNIVMPCGDLQHLCARTSQFSYKIITCKIKYSNILSNFMIVQGGQSCYLIMTVKPRALQQRERTYPMSSHYSLSNGPDNHLDRKQYKTELWKAVEGGLL